MKRAAAIDWENVRSRLRASERALEEALAEGPERIEAAYRQRAVRLAERQAEHEPASTGVPMLSFPAGAGALCDRAAGSGRGSSVRALYAGAWSAAAFSGGD